jgi:hypothetical protein
LELFVHRFWSCLRQSKWTKEKFCFVSAFRPDLLNDLERFISCGNHFLVSRFLEQLS